MGFFGLPDTSQNKQGPRSAAPVAFLHKTECKSCPLNHADCAHPKMNAVGDDAPLIYVLGPAPSTRDDKDGKPWSGIDARILSRYIKSKHMRRIRFGHVIRTFPGQGVEVETKRGATYDHMPRDPTPVEIECCRPSVIKDIEESKPVAIFGFGSVPLRWAANETHAYQWQGRRIPVKIGTHTCWYYPFVTPIDAIKESGRWDGHVDDRELTFGVALKNAVRECFDVMSEPAIHSRERIMENVEFVTGEGGDSDLRRIEKHLIEAANSPTSGLDYETNRLRPYNDDAYLLTAAVAIKGRSLAFPFEHRETKWTMRQLNKLDQMFMEFLLSKTTRKIVHQLAFEMEWSAVRFGREVLRAGKWEDTISQAYVINEMQGLLALGALTTQYFGFNIKELSNVNRKKLDDEPIAKVLHYNALDAKYHRLLYFEQKAVLDDLDMQDVYWHQRRRIPTLVLTQMAGIPIDHKVRLAFAKKYQGVCDEAFEEIKQLKVYSRYRKQFGEFEPTNNNDVARILKLLDIAMPKAAKGGDSTDQAFLKAIKHPIAKLILKHRKAAKILSTYVKPISPGSEHLFDDDMLHPIVSTTKVQTWRTSSEDPNIQNWPMRGPNVVIRKVVSKKKHKVVAFDYAGIQARNIAMESRDPTFINSFIDGYDIHKDWVLNLAKRYPKWAHDLKDPAVFKEARSGVKNQFVFPSFFGAGSKSIAPNLANSGRCAPPREVVDEMQEELFERFPKIKQWQVRLQESYKKNGYVTGLSGWRRHAPISYNQIINTPIQSDEALIVLTAMSHLSELDPDMYVSNMEIHDDLTFIWREDEVDARSDIVISELTRPRFDWIAPVPLVVEMKIGDNWCDLKEIGSFENVGTKGRYRQIK